MRWFLNRNEDRKMLAKLRRIPTDFRIRRQIDISWSYQTYQSFTQVELRLELVMHSSKGVEKAGKVSQNFDAVT